MAAYAGTTTVLWSVPFGSKRVSLVKVEVTNYNTTGIPLTAKQAGLAYIEAVFLTVSGTLDDAEAPVAVSYDPVNQVYLLDKGPGSSVGNDVNLHTTIGDILLLVVGS